MNNLLIISCIFGKQFKKVHPSPDNKNSYFFIFSFFKAINKRFCGAAVSQYPDVAFFIFYVFVLVTKSFFKTIPIGVCSIKFVSFFINTVYGFYFFCVF